ncbi:hypothetical protein [Ensifer sp.]|jgi:hypothetical protein|uniref:hypothetical protein n=1 Tax=Ensifer sp. TaxID=1872086 RepID=UPI002E0D2B8E|nr:hypothetical protein [Ensifer sp.]
MQPDNDALFRLLPAHIRVEDTRSGGMLRELLGLVGAQARAIERDIGRMYDNWFVETCEEWALPYIADLLGYRLPPDGLQGGAGTSVSRREIANLVASRRRKGSLWLLEELSGDLAGWPARAVEFYRSLAVAQHLDHPNLDRLATADVRDEGRTRLVGSAFDALPHLADIRRIGARASPGRHGIANVGLFVFRLRDYPVTNTEAYCQERIGRHLYTFSALGNDTPLFRRADREAAVTAIAEETNLPVPIRRRALEAWPGGEAKPKRAKASGMLYGEGRSIAIRVRGWPKDEDDGMIPAERVIPADLSDWAYRVPNNCVAVDPELGRIAFPARQAPRNTVFVDYRYGFVADIGGGEYLRPVNALPEHYDMVWLHPRSSGEQAPPHFNTFAAAFAHWRSLENRQSTLIVELAESGIYGEAFNLDLSDGETVVIRAAMRTRPILRIADVEVGRADGIFVKAGQGACLIIDGVMIVGGTLEMTASRGGVDPCALIIRHSTFVPGLDLRSDCTPRVPSAASIRLNAVPAKVLIESSVVGSILVVADADQDQRLPVDLVIRDSIVDATATERDAITGPSQGPAHALLEMARSTVVGQVRVRAVQLVENSILVGRTTVAHRQAGCIRYSYIEPGSSTCRRYACAPDVSEETAVSALAAGATAAEKAAVRSTVRDEVRPLFESTRFGTPAYMRLEACVADAIRRGAEGDCEMGVYFNLFEPRRLALLATRLSEYSPAGFETALVLVT